MASQTIYKSEIRYQEVSRSTDVTGGVRRIVPVDDPEHLLIIQMSAL